MKTNALIYCFKVWVSAVLIAPVIQATLNELPFHKQDVVLSGFVFWIFFAVLFGGGLSVPSLILMWLSLIGLIYCKLTNTNLKLSLSCISALLAVVPFLLSDWWMNSHFTLDSLLLSLPYEFVIVAGIWFYKLKQVSISNVETVRM